MNTLYCPICSAVIAGAGINGIMSYCDHIIYDRHYRVMYDWNNNGGSTRVVENKIGYSSRDGLLLRVDGLIGVDRIDKLLLLA